MFWACRTRCTSAAVVKNEHTLLRPQECVCLGSSAAPMLDGVNCRPGLT